jgi:uncharacterized protein (DUF1501 family)
MPERSMNQLDRRAFLAGGLTLGGAVLSAPQAGAWSAAARQAPQRNLVLLQLSGGNDGLSTVVPHADDAYREARSSTRHEREDLIPLNGQRGLHGGLANLGRWWERGNLAVIEGLGYPDMVRSHFKALEVWHTADRRGRAAGEGWIGRLAQAAWDKEDHPELVVHLGARVPWSVHSTAHPPVAMESPTAYRWFGEDRDEAAYGMGGGALDKAAKADAEHAGRDAALAHLRRVLDDARSSSRRIRRAAAAYQPRADYPRQPLGASLRDVAALIHGGLGSRVFSVTTDGFDTHAGQRAAHDGVMASLDGCLGAFLEDLAMSDQGRQTLVLVFSEFGRRVQENASKGTDHGKAGPAFLVGPAVKGGLFGAHPSLTELDRDDLAWTTDFRSLYGTVIEDWFETPMEQVLGQRYPSLGLELTRPS